jgi:thiosulfate/3-mercaptopyruvate sulfurtransferase
VKKIILFSLLALTAVVVLLFSVSASTAHSPFPGPAIDPIVSTEWLEGNLGAKDLVILDIRTPDEYGAGHIPGAINSHETNWYLIPPDSVLSLELPAAEDLFTTVGNAGITADSVVVIVSAASGPLPLAFYVLAVAARVADTLIYAGVKNVAILNGGYDKWVAEGKVLDTVPVTPTPVTYTGKVNEAMFVSKDYVTRKMRRTTILDGRDPEYYFGADKEPFYARPGHIPGATSLPAPYFWTLEGTYYVYRDIAVLKKMASGAVDGHSFFPREIIVYCGVGGYASALWFVLSEVAGYRNVKIFDGAAEEWTADPMAPVVLYKWE